MRIDQQVIEACKLRDSKAQKLVYERFAPTMLGVCMRYTKTREETEDILQEGFLTVFTKIDQFADKGSFEGWMRRIMVNAALMHFRKFSTIQNATYSGDEVNLGNIPEESDSELDADPSSAKDQILHADFGPDELMAVIKELPDGFRMVFNLTILEGYKHKEAAEMLGIAEATSKTQLLRARKLIQKKLLEKAAEKQKKGNKAGLLTLLALSMNDELNYIDELFQKEMGNLNVPPNTAWNSISQKLNDPSISPGSEVPQPDISAALQSSQGLVSSVGGKVMQFIGGHLQSLIIVSVATVASVGVWLAIPDSPDQPTPVPSEQIINNPNYDEIEAESIPLPNGPESQVIIQSEKNENAPQANAPNLKASDSTVYDTIQVIKHQQVLVPKQIRRTIEQKKVIQQSMENQN
jgi:RNA polymerase sigma factor (sigma-70 family)